MKICDKTNKLKSKYNHFKSNSPIQFEKCFQKNYTINSLNFFELDKIYNNYITNHNKKYYLYFIKRYFKLAFSDSFPSVKTECIIKKRYTNLRRYLLFWIDYFILKGYNLSHIFEMNFKTINTKRYITSDHYIKRPMPPVESKLNKIIAQSPHLMESLDRTTINPSNMKNCNIPFINQ